MDLKEKLAERVFIVRYEDLVSDTRDQVMSLFQFAGLRYHTQTEAFLKECDRKVVDTPYSVFKPKDVKDKWREDPEGMKAKEKQRYSTKRRKS